MATCRFCVLRGGDAFVSACNDGYAYRHLILIGTKLLPSCPLLPLAVFRLRLTARRSIRLWDMKGSSTGILEGHSDSVYRAILGSNDSIISCGEDHSAVSAEPQMAPADLDSENGTVGA